MHFLLFKEQQHSQKTIFFRDFGVAEAPPGFQAGWSIVYWNAWWVVVLKSRAPNSCLKYRQIKKIMARKCTQLEENYIEHFKGYTAPCTSMASPTTKMLVTGTQTSRRFTLSGTQSLIFLLLRVKSGRPKRTTDDCYLTSIFSLFLFLQFLLSGEFLVNARLISFLEYFRL
jgi:hypothetical protein